MLETVLAAVALALLEWWGSPWSAPVALLLLILCLPGIWYMRGAAPFITTSKRTMQAMLTLANIKHDERVYDLGCGDGRLIFAAAAQGADAIGFEMSMPVYLLAKSSSLLRRNTSIRYGNLWRQDYRDADVIFCYFLKDTMQDFYKRIWPTLKPGCRVVSHAFTIDGKEAAARDGDAVLYVKG
ncbi:class I SAM-dependent methyltransferase [Candidatus Peribacteria bacterium]|nr:class I SAM-dependent methyltransferase [Candidatus Peribacteria bacterium]